MVHVQVPTYILKQNGMRLCEILRLMQSEHT